MRIRNERRGTFRGARVVAAIISVVAIASCAGTPGDVTTPSAPGQSIAEASSPMVTELPSQGYLRSGTSYHASRFGEPFQFTVPAGMANPQIDVLSDGKSLRLRPLAYGAITIHDDASLPDDICQPTGVTDLTSVSGAERWLRQSDGLSLSPPSSLPLADGATATYWDVGLDPGCWSGDEPPDGPVIWFSAGERHRVYAVPSGDDVVIIATWGSGFGGGGEEGLDALNAEANELVQSFSFD